MLPLQTGFDAVHSFKTTASPLGAGSQALRVLFERWKLHGRRTLVVLALSGCFPQGCNDRTAERGEASANMKVVDAEGGPCIIAKGVDWRLEPHPQVPSEGDQAHVRFRFNSADDYSDPAVDACAADKERVVPRCQTVYASQAFGPTDDPLTGDDRLTVEHPQQVAEALLTPHDQPYDRPTCEADIGDRGGRAPSGITQQREPAAGLPFPNGTASRQATGERLRRALQLSETGAAARISRDRPSAGVSAPGGTGCRWRTPRQG